MSAAQDDFAPRPSALSTFLAHHGAKLFALAFWLLLIGGYQFFAVRNSLTPAESVRAVSALLTGVWGPLLYIALYALRPLIFFPSTLLTLLGGFLFGPWGILYTIVGANSSALLAYTVGRYFGRGLLDGAADDGLLQRYTLRLRQNSFETVLLLRLLFAPYDLVNYAAGFLKINWRAFLLATVLGSIPGTISFVLLGASFGSLDSLLAGDPQLNPATLILSAVLILAGILTARVLKRREAQAERAA